MNRLPVIAVGVLAVCAGLLFFWARSKRMREVSKIKSMRHREELLDEALMESFPASDPISVSMS